MNDEELFELMRREANDAPLGDRSDLRRGRSRLRRRRLVTGGSGVAGVALAAALVGGYVPTPGTGSDPAPATSPDSARDDAEQAADRTGRAVTKAMKEHTRIEEFGEGRPRHGLLVGVGTGENSRLASAYWWQKWHEDGGVGLLQVVVSREIETLRMRPTWFTSCTDLFGGGWISDGPEPKKYDSCVHRTVDGQPLLVGVEERSDRLWILVKYLREDDTVVEVGFSSPYLKTDAPVLDPSLTREQLVDVVTDPRVRLYLDSQ